MTDGEAIRDEVAGCRAGMRETERLEDEVANRRVDGSPGDGFDDAPGHAEAGIVVTPGGFSVAGRVIETVTGTSINAAIRDLVFKPLDLAHAGTTPGDFIASRFAVGHFNRGGDPPTLQRPFAPATS